MGFHDLASIISMFQGDANAKQLLRSSVFESSFVLKAAQYSRVSQLQMRRAIQTWESPATWILTINSPHWVLASNLSFISHASSNAQISSISRAPSMLSVSAQCTKDDNCSVLTLKPWKYTFHCLCWHHRESTRSVLQRMFFKMLDSKACTIVHQPQLPYSLNQFSWLFSVVVEV